MPVTILHTPHLSNDAYARVTSLISGEVESRGTHFRVRHGTGLSDETLAELRKALPFDVNSIPNGFQEEHVSLVLTDMDSTLINIECIDEIADFAGRKREVAAVTEAAMRGEIDFATSLVRRVDALKGLHEEVLCRVYEERLNLNPGAEELVVGLKTRGVRMGLVSGGFTFFTERLRARLGLDYVRGNQLEIIDGCITGRVLGAIVDADGKAEFLRELAASEGIDMAQTIAMGDGANDLKMMGAAGLGVAYRAKPRVQAQAEAVFNHSRLDAVLDFLQE